MGEFIKRLNWKGIEYLLDPATQALDGGNNPPAGQDKFHFSAQYGPSTFVAKPHPAELVDFGQITPSLAKAEAKIKGQTFLTPPGDFAYSIYNWESLSSTFLSSLRRA